MFGEDYRKKYLDLTNTGLKKDKRNIGRKFTVMAAIMLICTLVSMLSYHIEMLEANIVMIYLLGILFISYLAESYLYSLFASVLAVLFYNFFFTEPFYTFKVNNPNYFLTFFVMFVVGFITSMLTIRVNLGRQLVEDREEYISALYNIERTLLNVKSREELAKTSAEEISRQFNANVLVWFDNPANAPAHRYVVGEDVFGSKQDVPACIEAYQSGSPCGRSTTLFPNAQAYYKPVFSQYGVQGVIGIHLAGGTELSQTQHSFIDVIIPQIAVVLQREKNYEKQQMAQIEIQKERLRADMLRSVSHDFRTPLAGVMGLASTAIDNYDKMNDEVRKNFLQSIYEDANWLNEMVENILQTTRFEERRVNLNIEEEAAEEIITEAVTHVKKHANRHKISVNIPDEIILIKVDGVLIRQVLINLLNNAVSYSPEESEITVSLHREGNRAVFEIEDNGPGIAKDEMAHIFDRYYRSRARALSNRKGMGLGLSLCKSIVEAHGGGIGIRRNVPHGTIVSFYILSDKENS